MRERFYAEAIEKHECYGDPKVIVFREVWVAEARQWELNNEVDRARWNYDVDPEQRDPGQVLLTLGWQVAEDDDWKPVNDGLQANVEPRTE